MTRLPMLLDVALVVGGLVCIVIGVADWSLPAAWVVAGVALVALGLVPWHPPRRS